MKGAGTNQHTGPCLHDEIYNKREIDSSAINISEQHCDQYLLILKTGDFVSR